MKKLKARLEMRQRARFAQTRPTIYRGTKPVRKIEYKDRTGYPDESVTIVITLALAAYIALWLFMSL